MDDRTQQTIDKRLERELIRNERVIDHETMGRVKLRRPTPSIQQDIDEARNDRYFTDFQNEKILSQEEMEKIATKRGIWSPATRTRLTELSRRTGELMGLLDVYKYESFGDVATRFRDCYVRLTALIAPQAAPASEAAPVDGAPAAAEPEAPSPEAVAALDAVNRYLDLDMPATMADRKIIMNAATTTEVDAILDEGDDLRTQLLLLRQLAETRTELNTLQALESRLFAGTAEARADRAESVARIYYCCTNAETGKPLYPTLAEAWTMPATVYSDLSAELFYFTNGIAPEFRKLLDKHNYGFTSRVPDATEASSESSPGHPTSSDSGEPAVETSAPSSESPTSGT